MQCQNVNESEIIQISACYNSWMEYVFDMVCNKKYGDRVHAECCISIAGNDKSATYFNCASGT